MISLIIGLVVMYSLSKQIDSLHLSISGIQTNNRDLPDAIHSLQSQQKSFEQELINLKVNLNNVIITTSNLTQQSAHLNHKLSQLDESDLKLLPNLKQSSTDYEELKKRLANLQYNQDSIANSFKTFQEEIENLKIKMNQLGSRLDLGEHNSTEQSSKISELQMELTRNLSVINSKIDSNNQSITRMNSALIKIDQQLKQQRSIDQKSIDSPLSFSKNHPADSISFSESSQQDSSANRLISTNETKSFHVKKVLTTDNPDETVM
ncbi:hypothetical protein QR98_0096150 [Sarcoptes scabiei]|nr:hypothetical protein QR98_0096150 [Sarcoptes scabiei]